MKLVGGLLGIKEKVGLFEQFIQRLLRLKRLNEKSEI
jgi:hypothetical protein